MHGRNWACLLALATLLVAPAALDCQNHADVGRIASERDDAPALLRYRAPLPIPEPIVPQPGAPGRWSRVRTPAPFGFPQLAQSAGIIFSGTVSSIVLSPATRALAVETVTIRFHVEHAIRGTTAGANLTVSQWIAVWSTGQRYRVGERLLLFLYPPSKLGLTSCVAGPLGRFAVDPEGRVTLSAQHFSAFRTDPVLGGKSRVSLSDFALAVRQATEEE